jgi:GH15 family glucan-1,4-alpha-glucosidase
VSLRIEDYALIGDTQTAALVGRDGSVDWLCVPRFDSSACFAALLGDSDHGRWLLAPDGAGLATRRRYRPDTLILEQEWDTETGTVRVTDFMPPRHHRPRLFRRVEGISGRVEMTTEVLVRFEYGSLVPWVTRTDLGIRAVAGPDAVEIASPVHLQGEHLHHQARFSVEAGQQLDFRLQWRPSFDGDPGRSLSVEDGLNDTLAYWQEWAHRIDIDDCQWGDLVRRSLVTLKALIYAPTGGVLAAATTSLPEALGGVRNWDYRYCWVRDATLTLDALLSANLGEEAQAWLWWLVRAAAGSPDQLQIMYGPAGERRLPELEIGWLPGYEGSAPVRVGNDAANQFQLDVYGELMDAIDRAREHGVEASGPIWDLQRALLDFVDEHWDEPDDGIWEVRGPRRHFVHSRVMAWVAMDRGVRAVERYGLDGPVEQWRKTRDAIHEQVCAEGYNASVGAFTQYYGSTELDASVLMIPLVGFLPASDPRVISTVEAIQRDLLQDGFVLRYQNASGVDGLPGKEGAFLPCSYWLADCLAAIGRRDEARALFERLIALANDVGLLSEEYDPEAKRLIGNFPQAFTHVGLVNTARNLSADNRPAAGSTPPGVAAPEHFKATAITHPDRV